MTQHPSLRSSGKGKYHRSVLKRFERLKYLKEKGKWQEDMSVFGLPKIKLLKFKIKKEKAAAEEAVVAPGAEGAAATAPKEEVIAQAGKEALKKEAKGPIKGAMPVKEAPKKEEKPKK